MKAKEIIPASKPRNFVAKNQKTAGAGAHKDKKKAAKQGDVKHKNKEMAESTVELDSGEDTHYFRVRHQTERDIELEMPPRAWDGIGPAYATYEEAKTAFETLKSKHPNEKFTVTQHPRISHMGGVAKRVFPEDITMERDRDPEDWDEGNTEPPNNFAVYINGKKWKVFKGRGYYADDERERQHYYQLKDWAAKKTAATGKKWEVSITGEPATE
jgi:hypothetical protein